jgi:hypothetical protein
MYLSTKLKAVAGMSGVAAMVAFTAAPALALAPPTGNEQITAPVAVGVGVLVGSTDFTPPTDANGNPTQVSPLENVKGSGYAEGDEVYMIICDGKSPTAAGWNIGLDCDNGTGSASFPVGQEGLGSGNIEFFTNQSGYDLPVFRGMSPNDQFNCLAPGDDPNSTAANVPNLPAGGTAPTIDPTVPSWGASTVGANGGGTAPCTIRVAYSNVDVSTTSDKYIPFTLAQDATVATGPGTTVPESPLNIALPIGAIVLFGAAGAVLYRKRRPSSNAA